MAVRKIRDSVPYQEALLFDAPAAMLTTSCRPDRFDGADAFDKLASFLDEAAMIYGSLFRTAWKLFRAGTDAKNAKRALMASFPIKARLVNSAMNQAKAKTASLAELRKTQKAVLSCRIKALEEELLQKTEDWKKWHSSIDWRRPKRGDCARNKRMKDILYKKKNRLHRLKQKLNDFDRHNGRCCFGSRKLFLAQYHLEENGFQNHAEWKEAWRKARTSSFFLIGSKDESRGNQLCQLSPEGNGRFFMKLRSIYRDDKTDHCLLLKIPYLSRELEKNLQEGTAVSFQFVKNKKGWYIQPGVRVERKETMQVEGVLGIDINDGFLAVSGAAMDGSFVGFEDIPFPNDLCSKANASKLKEVLSGIFSLAEELHYGVAIENVNLTSRKSKTQRKGNKSYSRMLHSFAYTRYQEACESLSIRRNIPLWYSSACWTSVLGESYMSSLGITRHQSAAYVIALRALGIGPVH